MTKNFRIAAHDIAPLAFGYGGCLATDMITVEGRKVGFMYREEPSEREDSGWRFLSGFESQEYMDDPTNLEIYDVNTIANYDPDIIPLIESPIGAAFERNDAGVFVAVDFAPEEMD